MTEITPTTSGSTDDHDWFSNQRREAFRNVIKKNSSFDSRATARKLAQILKANDPDKKLRKRIAEFAWPDKPDTKYFYKLLIHGDETPTNLQRRPENYWKVGCALAHCLGLGEDTFTLDLFEGTSISREVDRARNREKERRTNTDSYVELAERISEMTEALSQQNDLSAFCRAIATTTARYDPHDSVILDENTHRLLVHGPLEGNFEVVEEWPPVPSVELYRNRRCADFDSTLAFAPDALPDDMNVNDSWREANRAERTEAWKTIPVRVTCWREVRLAIGPADASLQPRPLFELRSVFEIASREDGDDIELLTPWQYDHLASAAVVRIGKNRHVARVDLRPLPNEAENPWLPSISLDSPIQPEHSYATWRTVTPDLCRELLEIRSPDFLDVVSPLPSPQGATLTPAGTMAQLVEDAVLSRTIERELGVEVIRLKNLVDSYCAGKLSAARERHNTLRQHWQTK
jgi:hypothetical protein